MKLTPLISAFVLLLIFSVGQSQTQFKAVPADGNSILIEGTSNIHDWEILAKDFASEMDLVIEEDDLKAVNAINLSIPVKSFDSGKGKMDKNTYEAMNADTYELVSFTSTSPASVVEKSPGVYQALVKGELSMSGATNMVSIPVELYKTQSGYTLKAEQGLNMIDYEIEPPTALFGTITTGETVNVIFDLTHYKS
ncbi:YceI family protein [Psychroflexus sediminis]|uniref:YceI-like domain-containing protein n=1 Tax=Psychroflexus sediminis TaxID=470826 RepID=A0A1G7TRT4_9FLAO|nr:YceI family protein [Psychroflexus sediminis]SDG37947.1 YceI-like domain-containing protein [Psychroflexus sediminis]